MGATIVFVIFFAVILLLIGIFLIISQIRNKKKYNKRFSIVLVIGLLCLFPFTCTSFGIASISMRLNKKNIEEKGPLIIAIEKNDIRKIKKLLADNNDINEIRKFVIKSYYHYLTPLAFACKENNQKVAKLLIEYGADVNKYIIYDEKNEYSSLTPAMIACENNNLEMLKLLVDHGADINIKTRDDSAFLIALKKGDVELVQYLVDNNVDTSIKEMRNATSPILTLTYYNPNIEILSYIYKSKIDTDISCVDENGYNALTWAIANNCSKDYIDELLKLGINIEQITSYNSSMLDFAYAYDNKYMIDYLIEKGITRKDKN